MPVSDFLTQKHSTLHDSNIPILKKGHFDSLRKIKTKPFPEIQKYIERIIEASNEDNKDLSEDGVNCINKVQTEEKSIQSEELLESTEEVKEEPKDKENCNKPIPLNKASSTIFRKKNMNDEFPEKKIKHTKKLVHFSSQPKNSENELPTKQLESFLKKIYPNPYNLEEVNEFKNLKQYLKDKIEKNLDFFHNNQAVDNIMPTLEKTEAINQTSETDLAIATFDIKNSGDTNVVNVENINKSADVTEVTDELISNSGIALDSVTNHTNIIDSYRSKPDFDDNDVNDLSAPHQGFSSSDFSHPNEIPQPELFNPENLEPLSPKSSAPSSILNSIDRAFDNLSFSNTIRSRSSSVGSGLSDGASLQKNYLGKKLVKPRSGLSGRQDMLEKLSYNANALRKKLEKLPRLNKNFHKEDLRWMKPACEKNDWENFTADLDLEGYQKMETGSREKRKIRPLVDDNRTTNFKKEDTKSISTPVTRHNDIKKLYEIVDKTTEKLLLLATKNQNDPRSKEQQKLDKDPELNSIDRKFENNKFFKFVKDMNSQNNSSLKQQEQNPLSSESECMEQNTSYQLSIKNTRYRSEERQVISLKGPRNISPKYIDTNKKSMLENSSFSNGSQKKVLRESNSNTRITWNDVKQTTAVLIEQNCFNKGEETVKKKSLSFINFEAALETKDVSSPGVLYETNKEIDEVIKSIQEYIGSFEKQEKRKNEETKIGEKFLSHSFKTNERNKVRGNSNLKISHQPNLNIFPEQDTESDDSVRSLTREFLNKKMRRQQETRATTSSAISNEFRLKVAKKRRRYSILNPQYTSLAGREDISFIFPSAVPLPQVVNSNPTEQMLSEPGPVRNPAQTAESYNELGGYREEQPVGMANNSLNSSYGKVLFPLSVRIRKKYDECYNAVKNALEKEEKLLENSIPVGSTRDDLVITDFSKNISMVPCNQTNTTLLLNNSNSPLFDSYNLLQNLSNETSLLCVNSLHGPGMNTSMVPSDLSTFSFQNNTRYIVLDPDKRCLTFSLKYNTIEAPLKTSVYALKDEILLIKNQVKANVYHVANIVFLTSILEKSQEKENIYLQNSESLASIRLPLKKSLYVESNLLPTSTLTGISSCTQIDADQSTSQKNQAASISVISNKNDSCNTMETTEQNESSFYLSALQEAVENAEGSVQLLQQNCVQDTTWITKEMIECIKAWKSIASKSVVESKQDSKQVKDLLVRIYDLQEKLYSYLAKINGYSPALPSSSEREEVILDSSTLCVEKVQPMLVSSQVPEENLEEVKSQLKPKTESHSLVYLYLEPKAIPIFHSEPINHPNNSFVASKEIKMVDTSTSYHPPLKHSVSLQSENKNNLNSGPLSNHCRNTREVDNCSSTSSFKSSKDFSETHEFPGKNDTSQRSSKKIIENINFLKKIFSELEFFRKGKIEKIQSSNVDDCKPKVVKDKGQADEFEEPTSNRMVDYSTHSKTTAKVLKTVFKGKDSTTELAIGLKDVPMTNVSNISVEKKKFSQNHTKISICISKDKSSEVRKTNPIVESSYMENKDDRTKISSYFVSKHRGMVDSNDSSSESQNDKVSEDGDDYKNNDDENDDFQSVASSTDLAPGDPEKINEPKVEEINEEKAGTKKTDNPIQKMYKKHRFEFYEKMNKDFLTEADKVIQGNSVPTTICTYQEFEPLRQTLTDMQVKVRNIRRSAFLTSNEYYDRALKLAKMSAGFCQSCGSRSVIPEDTFGCYKSILPRKHSNHHMKYYLRNSTSPHSSFYSFRSNSELSDQYYDLKLNQSSSYLLNLENQRTAGLRRSVNNVSFRLERV